MHLPTITLAIGKPSRPVICNDNMKQKQQQQQQQQMLSNTNSLLKQQLRASLKEISLEPLSANGVVAAVGGNSNSNNNTNNSTGNGKQNVNESLLSVSMQPPMVKLAEHPTIQPPSANNLHHQFLLHMAANPMVKTEELYYHVQKDAEQPQREVKHKLEQQQKQQPQTQTHYNETEMQIALDEEDVEEEVEQYQDEEDERSGDEELSVSNLDLLLDSNDKSEPELTLADETAGLDYKETEANEANATTTKRTFTNSTTAAATATATTATAAAPVAVIATVPTTRLATITMITTTPTPTTRSRESAAVAVTTPPPPPSSAKRTASSAVSTRQRQQKKPALNKAGRPIQRRRIRRRAQSTIDDQAEHLTEMSVRGLDLFRYASVSEGVYQCTECAKENVQKTFKNKYSFQRHAFLYHEGKHRKVFPCPICGKEFSRPDKMKNHLKMVHDGVVSAKELSQFNPLNYLVTAAVAGDHHHLPNAALFAATGARASKTAATSKLSTAASNTMTKSQRKLLQQQQKKQQQQQQQQQLQSQSQPQQQKLLITAGLSDLDALNALHDQREDKRVSDAMASSQSQALDEIVIKDEIIMSPSPSPPPPPSPLKPSPMVSIAGHRLEEVK